MILFYVGVSTTDIRRLSAALEQATRAHQFYRENENNGALPFLDVLVKDDNKRHTVHRKKTHMDRYLHASYQHHSDAL